MLVTINLFGALGGGSPISHVNFSEMAMSHVSVPYFPQCHKSNIKRGMSM